MSLSDIICAPQDMNTLFFKEERHIRWDFILKCAPFPIAEWRDHQNLIQRYKVDINACQDFQWIYEKSLEYPWAFLGLEHMWDDVVALYTQSDITLESCLATRHQYNKHRLQELKVALSEVPQSSAMFSDALKCGMLKATYLSQMEEAPLHFKVPTYEEMPLYHT